MIKKTIIINTIQNKLNQPLIKLQNLSLRFSKDLMELISE